MTEHQTRYQAYMLRLWQTGEGIEKTWRASLEIPGTRERRGFACIQDLIDFLLAHTEEEGIGSHQSSKKGGDRGGDI